MSVYNDTAAYLDGLSTLASRGFNTIQAATEAILQLVTEQLAMRSSFLSHVIGETSQFEVLAAHNEPDGCDIEIGTIAPLSQNFSSMMNKLDGRSPLLLENIRSDPTVSLHSASVAFPRIGCYIGVPVVLSDGTFFGTLCSVDPEPRQLSLAQAKLLVVLARLLAAQIEREQQLSRRKWAEAELSQAISALQAANEQREYMNKMQGDFVSIVNHEFRTTLTGIQGFSELMRDEDFSYLEIKEYAADINADARRLSHMINQLLVLDQMKSGQLTLHLEQVDVNAIIMDVFDRAHPHEPGHRFRLKLDDMLPPLLGDRDKLIQVLSNLLSNAVKYSPAGGEVLLSSSVEDQVVHVRVQDWGMGIPSHALEQVFDPYYSRIEAETSRYVKGTGLGLSIVRQIVQMHGGKAWAESVLDQGSVFHFTIPLAGVPTTSEENND